MIETIIIFVQDRSWDDSGTTISGISRCCAFARNWQGAHRNPAADAVGFDASASILLWCGTRFQNWICIHLHACLVCLVFAMRYRPFRLFVEIGRPFKKLKTSKERKSETLKTDKCHYFKGVTPSRQTLSAGLDCGCCARPCCFCYL